MEPIGIQKHYYLFLLHNQYSYIANMSDEVVRQGTLIKRDRMRSVLHFGGEPKWQCKL